MGYRGKLARGNSAECFLEQLARGGYLKRSNFSNLIGRTVNWNSKSAGVPSVSPGGYSSLQY